MKCIRVEWPESKFWLEEYEDEVIRVADAPVILVPEELYNRVKNK